MSVPGVVLDHHRNIVWFPDSCPLRNLQALGVGKHGLKLLADTVREHELILWRNGVVQQLGAGIPAIIACSFNWFATTLVNHLKAARAR